MNISVSELMKSKLITLHPKDNLNRVVEIFKTYDLHHIPIVVMNEVRGIISQGDILFLKGIIENNYDEFFKNRQFEMMKVEDIMTSNPICIDKDETIAEACRLMTSHRINALPVTDKEELCGMITSYDLLLYFQQLN